MANTGSNKEHIPVGKWRTAPPTVVSPQRHEITNCTVEREKVAIAYACGLTGTLATAYLYASAENRKMCRRCAALYGLDAYMPGLKRHKDWWLDPNHPRHHIFENGRALGIIPHPLPNNWRMVGS